MSMKHWEWDKEFYHKLWILMLPIALQSLMLAAVAAGDAVMLGRVEQNSMSAVSLATQVQFIQNMMLGALTGTISILGSQYWGKGQREQVNAIFMIGIRLAAIVSVAFFAACLFFPQILMQFFTNEEVLIEIGCEYLRIASFSYLMTGFSQCYLSTMKITEHAGATALISSTTVVLNLILNAVFIFGIGSIPAMGARGAAIATLIARTIELIWAVIQSGRKNYFTPNYRELFHRQALLIKDFRRIMYPILGASLLWGIGFTSYTAIIGHMGTDAAAANSIAAVVRDLFCCLCNGIEAAGGIMVGYELGAGQLARGKMYGIRLARISVVLGIATMILVLIVTVPVVQFMLLTDTARELLLQMMVVMAVYMIGRCINTIVINGVFGAGGDTMFDMYSLVVMMWLIAIPLAAAGAFLFHWSPVLVYACTCLDEVGKLPWVYVHFKKFKWVKDLTR